MRTRAGVFDVSHMGEIEIAGKNALAAVQRISSNDASLLQVGQAQYAGLLTPDGTFVDDMLVYRMAPESLHAGRQRRQHREGLRLDQRAGQGRRRCGSRRFEQPLRADRDPGARRAREVLQPLTRVDLVEIGYYWFAYGEVANARATISRTGYTGEDGFEIFVPPNMADRVWQALLESGRSAT